MEKKDINKYITWSKNVNGDWSGLVTTNTGYKISASAKGNARSARADIKERLIEIVEEGGYELVEVEQRRKGRKKFWHQPE